MHLKVAAVVLVVIAVASAESPWKATDMEARVTFSGKVDVFHTAETSNVNWVEGQFYIVPLEAAAQSARLVSIWPEDYRFEEDVSGNRYLVFRWNRPAEDVLSYEVVWDVSTSAFSSTLQSWGNLNSTYESDIKTFLGVDELTVWTPYMKAKAEDIVDGSESVMDAAKRLTNWVHSSLTYDRDFWEVTSTAEKTFCSRKGVCDEFTNLFIAMSRSVGIPTRYVEGLVYSGEEWNFHAWAEVYVDGEWVSIDPTYNEIGFVDATHIALAKVKGDADVYNRIRWAGVSVRANFGRDEKSIEIEELGGKEVIEISMNLPERIGDSSQLEITAKPTNTLESKVVATCMINMPKEMILADEKEKSVMLNALGEGEISWKVASPAGLDKNWLHQMPIEIHCFPKGEATSKVTVDPRKSGKLSVEAVIVDLAVLSEEEALVRVRNDGTIELGEIDVHLCLQNGEKRCSTRTLENLKPGGIADVKFEVEAEEGDTVSATLEAEELESVTAETKLEKLEAPEEPEPAAMPAGNAETSMEPYDRTSDTFFLFIIVLVSVSVISALMGSIIGKSKR